MQETCRIFEVLWTHRFEFTVFPAFLDSLSREVSQGGKICCRCMFSVLISPLTLKIGGNGWRHHCLCDSCILVLRQTACFSPPFVWEKIRARLLKHDFYWRSNKRPFSVHQVYALIYLIYPFSCQNTSCSWHSNLIGLIHRACHGLNGYF